MRMCTVACVYVHVGDEADVDAVAVDIRDHGPTVLLVTCATSEAATTLIARLKEPAPTTIRGGGDKQKNVGYVTASYENLIVAGRSGYVKSVEAKQMEPAAVWNYIVAELKFSVHFCQMMQLSVAVAAPTPECVSQSTIQPDPEDVLSALEKSIASENVRLVAGQFIGQLDMILGHMRREVDVNVAAWTPFRDVPVEVKPAVAGESRRTRYGSDPGYIFVVGPVQKNTPWRPGDLAVPVRWVPPRRKQMWSTTFPTDTWGNLMNKYVPWKPVVTGCETTRGWTPMPSMKQKPMKVQLHDTYKLSVYSTGKSRRSKAKVTLRGYAAQKRWSRQADTEAASSKRAPDHGRRR